MWQWLNLLTLIRYFVDAAIAAYKFFQRKKEEEHDQAMQDLKDAKTEEEQREATRKLGRNP